MHLEKNANQKFYKNLPTYEVSLEELYSKDTYFTPLPENWFVLVADIKDSTGAVSNNQHNEVNLAATGCIVAVLNSLKKNKKDSLPYFFGGDGATFLVPLVYSEQLLEVLQLQKDHVKLQWNLDLVVGYISLSDVYEKGFQIQLAKIKLNKYLQIPVVLGSGLKYAEDLIKKSFSVAKEITSASEVPDLKGMECRWEKIPPPSSDGSVICLLVYCENEKMQRSIYLEVFSKLTTIFGDLENRQPISIAQLKLEATFDKIKKEMLATIGRYSFRYLLKKLFETYIGTLYFKYSKEGRMYLKTIEALSETVMLDGLINTIITGNGEQIKKLIEYLNSLEAQGKLVYGIHITHSSIMSCYVQDRKSEHAHFIDGTEGGYTTAAEMLKSKFDK